MSFELGETQEAGLASIVIPCYNAARFLVETLESAFTQTYAPIEIIVVDDGSTDGSVDMIRAYGDRLNAEFGRNRGGGAARNRGTALARGEFIQYLDADDVLTPDAIEKRVATLQQSNADVAYSDWETLIESSPNVFEVGERVTSKIGDFHVSPEMAMLSGFWVPLAGVTYRRTIIAKTAGWQEELPVFQDGRFMLDAALVGARFVHVSGVGTQYRVHPNSLSRRTSEAAFGRAAFHNGRACQEAFEAKGELSREQRYAIARLYNYAARSLFFHDGTAFRDCVQRLYKVEPGFRLSWPKVAQLASSILGFKVAGGLLTASVELRRALGYGGKPLS